MSLRVFWSDRLETMADRMLDEWASRPFGDPFARTCVVVDEPATREWLRDRFLLRRAPGGRRVLGNRRCGGRRGRVVLKKVQRRK